MSLAQFLFSFQGRIRRLHFWLYLILLWLFSGSVFWHRGFLPGWHHGFWRIGHEQVMAWSSSDFAYGPAGFTWHQPILLLIGVVLAWIHLAVVAKRWHDRDKSGWWILITLIPVIGWIWQLIECGFLDGTPGPNRYGPSPKAYSLDSGL